MLAYKGGYEIKPTRYSESHTGSSFNHVGGFVLEIVDDMSSIMLRGQVSTNRETCRQFIAVLNVLGRNATVELADALAQELANIDLQATSANFAKVCGRKLWQLPLMNIGISDGWLMKGSEQ